METGVLGREEPESDQTGMRGEHYEANQAAMAIFYADPVLFERLLATCRRLRASGCHQLGAGDFWDAAVSAEDLASEAVLKAMSGHRKLTATTGDEAVRQLAKIAWSYLLNHQRRAKFHARHAVVGPAPEGDRPADGSYFVDPAVRSDEVLIDARETIKAALSNEPEMLAYFLCRLELGGDRKAIAREMGISDSNVNAIHRRFERRIADIEGFEDWLNTTEGNA